MSEVDNQDPVVENLDQQDINDGSVVVDTGEKEAETTSADTETTWIDGLGPDFKNNPAITKFKTPEDLAKSYVNLEKMIGKEKIVLPKDDASPEELEAFHKSLGRPDDIAGYETPVIEDAPQETLMADTKLETFKQKALELGLNKQQFAELYKLQQQITANDFNQQVQQAQEMAKKTETELRQEYGAAYEAKIDGAQKVINSFFTGKPMHDAFKVLSSDKGFVQAMSEIAEKLGEDVIQGGPRLTMTPKEAQDEYNAMLGNKEHPFHSELHPEHDAAVQRSIVLQQAMMAGGE